MGEKLGLETKPPWEWEPGGSSRESWLGEGNLWLEPRIRPKPPALSSFLPHSEDRAQGLGATLSFHGGFRSGRLQTVKGTQVPLLPFVIPLLLHAWGVHNVLTCTERLLRPRAAPGCRIWSGREGALDDPLLGDHRAQKWESWLRHPGHFCPRPRRIYTQSTRNWARKVPMCGPGNTPMAHRSPPDC